MIFIWSFALVIGILVFVHELGHYLAARSVGVRVEKFSIGFPPRFFTATSVTVGLMYFFFSGEKWIYKWKLYLALILVSQTGLVPIQNM